MVCEGCARRKARLRALAAQAKAKATGVKSDPEKTPEPPPRRD